MFLCHILVLSLTWCQRDMEVQVFRIFSGNFAAFGSFSLKSHQKHSVSSTSHELQEHSGSVERRRKKKSFPDFIFFLASSYYGGCPGVDPLCLE